MTTTRTADLNKYRAIGSVSGEPKVKYVQQTQSYLVEFQLESRVLDPLNEDGELLPVSHCVVARNEKLALFLKDVLQPGLRLFIEGALIPRPASPLARGEGGAAYHIDLSEVELIDAPDRPRYPEGIKRLDK